MAALPRLWLADRMWTARWGQAATLIEDAALVVLGEQIAYAGPRAALPAAWVELCAAPVAQARLITPGLIDAHTHLVFAGSRADEYEQRLAGASYADIAARGGGIAASVRATRAASEDELLAAALQRARALMADGVTTVEIKSGYGLEAAAEAKMLRVARRIGSELGIRVRTSYLALHALPGEWRERRAEYVDLACGAWLASAHAEGLVDAVDAYLEHLAFDRHEVRKLFESARALGLPLKLHAEQLSNQHGAALAAEFGALSADHLEYLDADGVAAMARAGTVAMLIPAAYLLLKETQLPPIAALRQAGVPMAVASDLNPGTSPILSLRLAMSLACTLFGLTVEEAWRGATLHAARALGLGEATGCLQTSAPADFVLWDAASPAELLYWLGDRRAQQIVCAGRIVAVA
jgi:imidazolonepropionase